jgi:hypothetical protein
LLLDVIVARRMCGRYDADRDAEFGWWNDANVCFGECDWAHTWYELLLPGRCHQLCWNKLRIGPEFHYCRNADGSYASSDEHYERYRCGEWHGEPQRRSINRRQFLLFHVSVAKQLRRSDFR